MVGELISILIGSWVTAPTGSGASVVKASMFILRGNQDGNMARTYEFVYKAPCWSLDCDP